MASEASSHFQTLPLTGISNPVIRNSRPANPNQVVYPEYGDRVITREKAGWMNYITAVTGSRLYKRGITLFPIRALVAGIGRGDEMERIAVGSVDEIVGVDISPVVIARAQDMLRLRTDMHFMQADVSDLSAVESGSMHFVLASSTLHEVESYHGVSARGRTLDEFRRVLAPGGIMLIREFMPPESGELCNLQFRTPFSAEFFVNFVKNFSPIGDDREWTHFDSNNNGSGVVVNRRFAEEIIRHFIFHTRNWKDYYNDPDYFSEGMDKKRKAVFASIQKGEWEQLYEKYVLAKNGTSFSSLQELVRDFGFATPEWRTFAYVARSPQDDKLVDEHFTLANQRGRPILWTDRRVVMLSQKKGSNLNTKTVNDLRGKAVTQLTIDKTQPEFHWEPEEWFE